MLKQNEDYKNETMRRYGYLYNGEEGTTAPSLSRGFGASPSQKVKREMRFNHHAPTGPLARRLRVPLGKEEFNPNRELDKDRASGSGSGYKKGGSSGGSGTSGGGGFNRPF